ncbi:MAG: hypothetical protein U1F60_04225 [Planctomycetota bacterium]
MTSVLVVDRSALFDGPWPHGFTAFQPDQAEKFLARIAQLAHLEPRPLAETTRAWKQLIPYCLLTCGDRAEGDLAAFAVQRTRGQSEGRLHGSWSLGIGGHIDELDVANCPPGDRLGSTLFRHALLRELSEELDLGVAKLPTPNLLGLLNDDTTDVGSVHAGLAYHIHLPTRLAHARDQVKVRETEKMRGGFTLLADLPTLWQNPARLETWSQMLLDSGIHEFATS